MRRNVALIVLLIAVLCLSACSPNESTEQLLPSTFPEALAWVSFPDCKTLEEYNSFLETYGDYIPDNFVSYDDLAFFGEFDYFNYSLRDTETGAYLSYTRTCIKDANGGAFGVKVGYYNQIEPRYRETLPFEETVKNMRTHPSGKSGTVYRDSIDYIYYKGNLHYIIVHIDGLVIQFGEGISPSRRPYQYPKGGEDTPFARLLSADLEVASGVVEELAAHIQTDNAPAPAADNAVVWIIVGVAAAVLIAGAVVLVIILKKKKAE